jgi:hypothetical protein
MYPGYSLRTIYGTRDRILTLLGIKREVKIELELGAHMTAPSDLEWENALKAPSF